MEKVYLKNYDAIVAPVQQYLDSCKEGKSEIMKSAFTDAATINGAPIQTLFDGVDKAGASEVKGRIDVVEVINDIAIVRVVMENYFGDNFIDFHTLKRDNNEWKIVAKVFTAF